MQRSNNSNNNHKEGDNNNASFVPHPACAACKHQRRKCDSKCLLYPYFPAEKALAFQAVHKVYGVSNVSKMIISVKEEDRKKVVDSLIWEAMWRRKDPIFGTFGVCQRLQHQLRCYKKLSLEQAAQLNQLTRLYKQPNSSNLIRWDSVNNNGIDYGSNYGGKAIDVDNDTALTINHVHDNDLIISSNLYSYPANSMQILENLQEKEVDLVGPMQQDVHDDFNHPQFFLSGTLKEETKQNYQMG